MKLTHRKQSRETGGGGKQLKLQVRDFAEVEKTSAGMAAIQKIADTKEFAAVDSAVEAVFGTGSSHDAEKVVKTLKARLLSDEAVGLLAYREAMARDQGDDSSADLFALYRRLLIDCRAMGIGAAFDEARRHGVEAYLWDA